MYWYWAFKTLVCKDSGRSSDFIAPSLANGCVGACAYCYVDRNKRVNPITLFTNTEEILTAVDKHVQKQPWTKYPIRPIHCIIPTTLAATLIFPWMPLFPTM
jgi:DNA repair photolyase